MRATRKTVGVLLICGTLTSSQAQSGPPLSKHAVGIKPAVERLSPQAHISVIPRDGSEEFGDYSSHDAESFTFYDIDRKATITLRFEAVKKIRSGYGGYNSVNQRHVDRHRELTVVAVVVGVLGAVIGAAAATK